jgi:hypothetical protein
MRDIYGYLPYVASTPPKEFFDLVMAMTRKYGHRVKWRVGWRVFGPPRVVQVEITRFVLRHGEETGPEWRVTSSPDRVVGTDNKSRIVRSVAVIPKLDALVQRACDDAIG